MSDRRMIPVSSAVLVWLVTMIFMAGGTYFSILNKLDAFQTALTRTNATAESALALANRHETEIQLLKQTVLILPSMNNKIDDIWRRPK